MADRVPMAEFERALAANPAYVEAFQGGALAAAPARRLAVIACMDARITVADVLSLEPGDAHVIRNAGGLATDDAIRSLVVSQLLGIDEVIVLEHTGCGMLTFRDEEVRRELADRTGADVDLPLQTFDDLDRNIAAQVDRIRAHPWIGDIVVHGLVYDVATGRLRLVV